MRMGQPYANPNTQKSYNLAGETLTPDKKNKIGTYSKRQKKVLRCIYLGDGKPGGAINRKSQADMGGGSITPPASVLSLVTPLRGVRQQQTVTLDTQAPIWIQPNPETE